MSKIAVTSQGPTLDDPVDSRFGRAAGFVVVDMETKETTYLDNGASQALAQGAGIQAAEVVVRAGVSTVLTGYVGPKAFQALQAGGVAIVQDLGEMTVRQALEAYAEGKTDAASGPNARGHH
jgi:predicted Fe-Mo cluster-binding NifX family protein